MVTRYARIKAIRSHLPAAELSNETLAKDFPGWTAEKILEKTGIETRRIAAEGECASDLAFAAAEKLFADGIVAREDIDFLLLCTQSPDYLLPTSACVLQQRLGLGTHIGALDFNLGCSGFVYGLSLARGLIESGDARRVLLITAETYSKYIHPQDKSVRTLFGDGASATLIEASDAGETCLGPFVFGTDGRGAKNLIVKAGASRLPCSPETARVVEDASGNLRSEDNLYMNGPEILTFTLRSVPEAVRALLAKSALSLDQIDYFVFHQANKLILDSLRHKLRIPETKFCVSMKSCGNTVSASIPMALEKELSCGRLGTGNLIMVVGFGLGYSWAAAMVRL